jgi:hypothetical protein
MKQLNASDDDPQVGQFRMVPCVKLWRYWYGLGPGAWLPVIGPEHEDAEIINFPDHHWHIDWRFVPKIFFESALGSRREQRPAFLHGIVITAMHTATVTPVARRMRMKRPMPAHAVQNYRRSVPWMKKLEAKFKDVVMKCRTCPHRGLPLGSVTDGKGNYVCTGHGLKWNARNGRLIARA